MKVAVKPEYARHTPGLLHILQEAPQGELFQRTLCQRRVRHWQIYDIADVPEPVRLNGAWQTQLPESIAGWDVCPDCLRKLEAQKETEL